MVLKQELTHYRADELFPALEAGRKFLAGGRWPIIRWERRELLDNRVEYTFTFESGVVTGGPETFLGCVELMLPALHLNGTGYADLLDDLTECASRISVAMSKMRQSGPHARDYYVQRPGAYQDAIAQHEDRLKRLEGVLDEFRFMADALCDANDRREAMKAGR